MKPILGVSSALVVLLVLSSVVVFGQPAAGPAAAETGVENPDPAESVGPQREIVELPEGIVARVNGQDITRQQLIDRCLKLAGRQVLNQIFMETVIEQECKKKGVKVSDEMVDEEVKKIRNRELANIPEEQRAVVFEQILARRGTTLQMLREEMKLNMKVIKLAEKEVEVTEEDIRKAYEAQYGSKVMVSHILLATEEAAKMALDRIREGEGFASVAEAMSTDVETAADGGRLRTPINRGFGLVEFRDAAFALKRVGDVSGVIKSAVGFHIIRLDQKIPASDVKVEDVRDQIVTAVRQFKALQQSQTYLTNLVKGVKIQESPSIQ